MKLAGFAGCPADACEEIKVCMAARHIIMHIIAPLRFVTVKSSQHNLPHFQTDQQLHQEIEDRELLERLKEEISGREIIVIAPGHSIVSEKARVKEYIEENHPVVFTANFSPEEYDKCCSSALSAGQYHIFDPNSMSCKETSGIPSAELRYPFVF